MYNKKTGVITFDEQFIKKASSEEIAKVFLHEMVHHFTVKYVEQYIDANGNFKDGVTVPKEVIQLFGTSKTNKEKH